jgi:hypothetical protein
MGIEPRALGTLGKHYTSPKVINFCIQTLKPVTPQQKGKINAL